MQNPLSSLPHKHMYTAAHNIATSFLPVNRQKRGKIKHPKWKTQPFYNLNLEVTSIASAEFFSLEGSQ